jgi:ABC-type Fe3+-hydroxamate transport system substrate-binding protein
MATLTFTDQTNQTIQLNSYPKRIVSLVPSQTELLFDLGLDEAVIGITKFCIHPNEWFRHKTRIGGTKNVNIEKVRSLQPDLIIANKEENTQSDIEVLQQIAPVWISDIYDLTDALAMIEAVGAITNTAEKATVISTQIAKAFDALQSAAVPSIVKPCLYLIWKKPYMAAGQHTFINDMLKRCGYSNVLPINSRYPEVDISQYQSIQNLTVLLSSEPYPFKAADIQLLQEQLPHAHIQLVDGEMFSWYGSRLLQLPHYFKHSLH